MITSTFGYNGYYLSPASSGWSAIAGRPWQNLDRMKNTSPVFTFADAALPWGLGVKNTALLDPPSLFMGGLWYTNLSPTTSFRHNGFTNAAHVDGHVASLRPQGGKIVSAQQQIGSVGAENDPHYVPDWRDW